MRAQHHNAAAKQRWGWRVISSRTTCTFNSCKEDHPVQCGAGSTVRGESESGRVQMAKKTKVFPWHFCFILQSRYFKKAPQESVKIFSRYLRCFSSLAAFIPIVRFCAILGVMKRSQWEQTERPQTGVEPTTFFSWGSSDNHSATMWPSM